MQVFGILGLGTSTLQGLGINLFLESWLKGKSHPHLMTMV